METQETVTSSQPQTVEAPKTGFPVFRAGDTVEINGGRFKIKSIGKKMMLLYCVAGHKPMLEENLPIQSRIETCERELKRLLKERDK